MSYIQELIDKKEKLDADVKEMAEYLENTKWIDDSNRGFARQRCVEMQPEQYEPANILNQEASIVQHYIKIFRLISESDEQYRKRVEGLGYKMIDGVGWEPYIASPSPPQPRTWRDWPILNLFF